MLIRPITNPLVNTVFAAVKLPIMNGNTGITNGGANIPVIVTATMPVPANIMPVTF